MTRPTSNMIQHASGEQLLMLAVFFGDQCRGTVNHELDRRAAMRPIGAVIPRSIKNQRGERAA